MVKIHEEGAFRVFVYAPPREHRPPHVHVECSRGGEILIRLGAGETPPSIWMNHHMAIADARVAFRIVVSNRDRFLEEWRKLHG